MKIDKRLLGVLSVVLMLIVAALAYRHWSSHEEDGVREQMLSTLPEDPSAVIFVDIEQFRSSAFLAQLLAWAPQLPVDEEYKQFVQATGLNYERDIARLAIAYSQQASGGFVYGVADGRFDRKKIEAYAARSGERIDFKKRGGKTAVAFLIKLKNSGRVTFFTFLRDDRIGWTNDPAYAAFFDHRPDGARSSEWKEHSERLAGSPLFAILRQDASTAAALSQQTPGGLRSPQLAALVSQLEWMTVGAKPDGNILRVVLEGESTNDTTIRQLRDFLNGIFLMAQMGLNGAQNRKQMDPKREKLIWSC